MSMSSEWTLTVPFDGGWMQVSGKIPDMGAVSDDDAKFVDSIREQVLDRIKEIILARKLAESRPDGVPGSAEPGGGEGGGGEGGGSRRASMVNRFDQG